MENQRIVLASRPEGWVTPENFRLEKGPLPKIGDGEVLVKNLWLSLDPYMRGRMSDAKSYVKGVDLGEVMVGQTAGEVLESNNPAFKKGDQVLTRMNLFGRVVVCGMIADYNATESYRFRNLRAVLVNRLKIQGMIVFDWKERYGEALKALGGYYAAGKLKTRESVVEGLANAPQGLIALLKGGNFGKQLVKLA